MILLKGITWLGVKTKKFKQMCTFYETVIGLSPVHEETGFKVYKLSNGDQIEVFASSTPYHHHFTTGPVAGFEVENIQKARKMMEKRGIQFIGTIDGDPKDSQWSHFRGPDGNIYELTCRKRKRF